MKFDEFVDYMLKCCRNIVGEIPARDCKYGMSPATLQIAKMKQELEMVKKGGLGALDAYLKELKKMAEEQKKASTDAQTFMPDKPQDRAELREDMEHEPGEYD
jgi:ERCC4-related helicase